MIKFLGVKDGRTLLGIGLSRGNCNLLLDGKPIEIDIRKMMGDVSPINDLNEGTILIFGGETEATMHADLARLTNLPPQTSTFVHHEENR